MLVDHVEPRGVMKGAASSRSMEQKFFFFQAQSNETRNCIFCCSRLESGQGIQQERLAEESIAAKRGDFHSRSPDVGAPLSNMGFDADVPAASANIIRAN